jgi:3-deoxy-D-manno-octulosonic-acid transferase
MPHWQMSANKDHGAQTGSFRLRAYRAGTSALKPLAPLILNVRERRGKEDPARRQERLGISDIKRPEGPLIWLHAASVGETNAILPVIAALEAARPNVTCLLTTGTTTSAKLATARLSERAIHQFVPLDAPQFVRQFLNHWQPEMVVFTESEIWPNLITYSAERDVPLILVNARMSQKSFRKWRRNIKLARELFGRFDLVLAQNEKLARRFQELGVGRSKGVGNLKIDAPPPPIDEFELQRLRRAFNGRPLVLAASTHPGEEEILADVHRTLKSAIPGCHSIVAPRHPERGGAIAALFAEQGFRVTQRSLGELPDQGSDIYVADTIGELGMLFALAPVAFMGGSLVPHGGQNPIEAVRHDTAVLTGPHWRNFTDEYRMLLQSGGAREVTSGADMADAMSLLISDEAARNDMLQNARDGLAKLSGALPLTIETLLSYLPEKSGMKRAS